MTVLVAIPPSSIPPSCHGCPDGAVRFVTSGLEVFAEEFAGHARHGRCDACASAPELPMSSHVELAAAA